MTQEELRARFEGAGTPKTQPSQEELAVMFGGGQTTEPPMMENTHIPEPPMMENTHPQKPLRVQPKGPQSAEEMLAAPLNVRTPEGIGMGFMDPAYGAAQLTAKGVERVTGKPVGNYFDAAIRKREEDYGKTDGFDAPRMFGTALNPATWIGPKKVQMSGRFLKGAAEALVKHTGTNTLQSTLMPVNPDENYWTTQAGRAAFGALIGDVISGGGATVSGVHRQLNKWFANAPAQATKYLKEMFGDQAGEVARRLDNLKSDIPGEQPTVGWLSLVEDGKWPQMAAIENQARASETTAGKFNIRDKANMAARLRLFDKMRQGGVRPLDATGKQIESVFEKNARRNSSPIYDSASGEMIYVPNDLKTAMRGTEAARASQRGEDFITQAELNAKAGLSKRPPVPGPIRGGEVNPPTPENIDMWNQDEWKNNLPMESIGSLQSQRQSMDSLLKASQNTTDPNAIEAARLLREVRGGLTDRMRQASPKFDIAETIYREGMAPQNRADYVSALRQKYDTPGGANEIAFLRGLQDPTKTAKGAGIPFKVDSTQQIMGGGNAGQRRMSQIDALRGAAERDLALKSVYAPDKVKDQFKGVGQELDEVLPPFLSAKVTAIKRLGQLFEKNMSKGMRKVLDEAALDPNRMAQLLRDANPEDRHMIMNGLRAIQESGVRPVAGTARAEMSRQYGGPK